MKFISCNSIKRHATEAADLYMVNKNQLTCLHIYVGMPVARPYRYPRYVFPILISLHLCCIWVRATIFVENNFQSTRGGGKISAENEKFLQCIYATHVETKPNQTKRNSNNQTIMHIIMPSIYGNYQ